MIRGRALIGTVILAYLLSSAAAQAQGQTPASPDPGTKEHNWGPYVAGGSVGLGGQFVDVNGSQDRYRTDFNYQPGVNLSDFTLNMTSEANTGKFFDHLNLTGYGFGDAYPYERARLAFGKRGRYEFRGDYWKQAYFFSIPSFALGGHSSDSARRATDLSLRIFLKPSLTAELGYYRNYNYGTAFTTGNDFQRVFELSDPRRALTQDFRAGLAWAQGPLSLSVFEGLRLFKQDPNQETSGSLVPQDTIPSVQSTIPVRMNVLSTQVLGRWAPNERTEISGRYRYSDGHADTTRSGTIILELAQGMSLTQLIRGNSVSDRPEHDFDLHGTVAVTDRVTVGALVDGTRFDVTGSMNRATSFTPSGPGPSIEGTATADTYLQYSQFRIRPDVEIALLPKWSFHVGYQYSDRGVRQERGGTPEKTRADTGIVGLIWKPYRQSRIVLDYENGSANNAFTPIEPRKFQNWRLNGQFMIGPSLSVSPVFVYSQRLNRTAPAYFDSDYYQAGVEARYAFPGKKAVVSGGYTILKFDSLSSIQYFLGYGPVAGTSQYSSRLQFVHTRVELPVTRRATFRFGYEYFGDPQTSSYPLRRHLGEAGLALRVYRNCIWDLHWENVSYNETIPDPQNYMANLLGITLRWSY